MRSLQAGLVSGRFLHRIPAAGRSWRAWPAPNDDQHVIPGNAGNGSRLQSYRFWQLFSRSLFSLEFVDRTGRHHVFEVDVRHSADSSTKRSPASLYREGVQVLRGDVPVVFPVPDGVIEMATSLYGVERIHYVGDAGHEQVLSPHPRSPEGLWARFDLRFPRTSALIGTVGLVVLLVVLAVTSPWPWSRSRGSRSSPSTSARSPRRSSCPRGRRSPCPPPGRWQPPSVL